MTSMLEKAARALARSRIYDGYNAETKETEFLRNKSILFAEVRAVLGAIRDPDDAVANAMFEADPMAEWASKSWAAGIDAILAEGKGT